VDRRDLFWPTAVNIPIELGELRKSVEVLASLGVKETLHLLRAVLQKLGFGVGVDDLVDDGQAETFGKSRSNTSSRYT
jgi:hypothetical protein